MSGGMDCAFTALNWRREGPWDRCYTHSGGTILQSVKPLVALVEINRGVLYCEGYEYRLSRSKLIVNRKRI